MPPVELLQDVVASGVVHQCRPRLPELRQRTIGSIGGAGGRKPPWGRPPSIRLAREKPAGAIRRTSQREGKSRPSGVEPWANSGFQHRSRRAVGRFAGLDSPDARCYLDELPRGLGRLSSRRRNTESSKAKGQSGVVKLTLRDKETAQEAVRRFRKLVERSGIKKEIRVREFYEKPSETKRRARLRAQRRARRDRLMGAPS